RQGGGKVGLGAGKPDVQNPAEERHALRPALGRGKDATRLARKAGSLCLKGAGDGKERSEERSRRPVGDVRSGLRCVIVCARTICAVFDFRMNLLICFAKLAETAPIITSC